MKLNAGLNNCWSTPIYKTSILEEERLNIFNKILLTENFNNPKRDNISSLKNDIPELKDIAHKVYGDFFRDVYNLDINKIDYKIKSWLARPGAALDLHNHKGSPFVSVVYVMAEDENPGGEIIMQDPRGNANRGYFSPFDKDFEPIIHKPKSGDVLIMPGYVYHFVRPNMSNLRLAVPIDFFIQNVKE